MTAPAECESLRGFDRTKEFPVKAGRNDPCPCGSEKKYKRCCGSDTVGKKALSPRGLAALLGFLFVLAVAGVVAAFYSSNRTPEDPTRVWSAEHGHWH